MKNLYLLLLLFPLFTFGQKETNLELTVTTENAGIYLSSEHFLLDKLSVGPYFSYQKIKDTDFHYYKLGGYANFTLYENQTISFLIGGSAGLSWLNVGDVLELARISAKFAQQASASSAAGNTRQLRLILIERDKALDKARGTNEFVEEEVFDAYLGVRLRLNNDLWATAYYSDKDNIRLGIRYTL